MYFCIRKKGTPHVPFCVKGQATIFNDAISAAKWHTTLNPDIRDDYEVIPVKVTLTFYDDKE